MLIELTANLSRPASMHDQDGYRTDEVPKLKKKKKKKKRRRSGGRRS